MKLGPIVRVGSSEISVNSPELVKQVYGEVLEKDEWYCLQLLRNVDSSSSSAESVLLPHKSAGDTPVVYQRLSQSLGASVKEAIDGESSHLAVASELMDHIKAGTETSGWTLVYLLYEMSRHREIQQLLREELSLLLESGTTLYFSTTTQNAANVLPSPRTLDASPLLQAVILETLRCYPAVAGPQPRIIHNPNFTLARHIHLPAGTRVSAQAYSLHRNSDVFPDPESWNPQRWLEATPGQQEEMMRWFWPFGSGSRMCIGNHFANLGKS